MNFVILREAAAFHAPPSCSGSPARMPTGQPSSRAKPVMMARPNAACDFEERPLVDHLFDDAPHLIRLLAVARHGRHQGFVAPVRIVPALGARRQLPDRRRQIGEELARAFEGFFLRVDGIVDSAGGDLHLVAAELLLGALLAEPVDHRGAGDEHGRRLLHHQRVVAGRQARGAEACDRTETQRDDGDEAHVDRAQVQAGRHRDAARQIGVALRLDRLDRAAAARSFDDADDRHAELRRHPLRHLIFFADRCVRRAAAHGEIVAEDHHRTAVDPAAAEHAVAGDEVDHVAVFVVLRLAGNAAQLMERVRVEDLVDALADGKSAAGMLTLDPFLAAHLPGDALAFRKLVQFLLPTDLVVRWPHAAVHGRSPSRSRRVLSRAVIFFVAAQSCIFAGEVHALSVLLASHPAHMVYSRAAGIARVTASLPSASDRGDKQQARRTGQLKETKPWPDRSRASR